MKTYKTWEVIETMSKNNELKFKAKTGRLIVDTLITSDLGVIEWESGINFELNKYTMELEWELIQEPVDFITAINSGKKIKSEFWDDYEDVSAALRDLASMPSEGLEYCVNGKWFIEEEE